MTTQNSSIEIPLSKTKMLLTLCGALLFVVVGIFFIINPSIFKTSLFADTAMIFVVGIISSLFFGIIAIMILYKFFQKKHGFIINEEGITDYSSGLSLGTISWKDIQEVKIAQVMSQKFLVIIVSNPEEYINKATSPIKRNAMKMNFKTYDSPICISSNALKIKFDDLYRLLNIKIEEYKQQ